MFMARTQQSRWTRACLQRSEPEQAHADREHGRVVDGALLVPGRDAAELLEAVDQSLDAVALPIGLPVEAGTAGLPLLRRDHRADAAAAQEGADRPAGVGLVARHPARAQ